jgi:hypothetical protein
MRPDPLLFDHGRRIMSAQSETWFHIGPSIRG